MGLQTSSGSGGTMPKLSMPIKNATDLSYFNGLMPVVIGNGKTVNKDFSLTQTQGVTLTATIQTSQNVDGKRFYISTSSVTPHIEAKLTDTANYASNELKSGVKQSDGSYRYQIEATLPKVDLDAEIRLAADGYDKTVTKNLNANLDLGVVELELDE